jgi:uncharacterized repeat protein (TIGR03803 family)
VPDVSIPRSSTVTTIATTLLAACGASNIVAPSTPLGPAVRIAAPLAPLAKESVLWSFTGGNDGGNPIGGVIADAAGNLYGGTIAGGPSDKGTIFELIGSGKRYTEKTLVSFHGKNGNSSAGALTLGPTGELYGVTVWGGRYGYGSAFQLSTKGRPREHVIWSFNYSDGANPDVGMVLDDKGALYGTTAVGGAYGAGVVYKLTPAGQGYSEKTLWTFGQGTDGKYSAAPLTLGANGVIYGTAGGGGKGCRNGCGIVFELTPSKSGYAERILYNFKGADDGSGPSSGVTIDGSGTMYGVTNYGGGTTCASGYGCGTAYELTPQGAGSLTYTERVLWSFGKGTDGYYPMSNVVIGKRGELYGTAWQGGTYNAGTAYELVPHGGGYRETILWNFSVGDDGYDPRGNILMDDRGRLYGACYAGGSSEFPDGTVFRITP